MNLRHKSLVSSWRAIILDRGGRVSRCSHMRSPAQSALRFTASSPAAVVLTVWPSGTGELATVRAWLDSTAARIVHEQPVPLKTELAELLTVMALYEGEEWVETNCWYSEQTLPTGPPEAPYAGAKWKRALCFRNAAASRAPHCFVLDVSPCLRSLWLGLAASSKSSQAAWTPPPCTCMRMCMYVHTCACACQHDMHMSCACTCRASLSLSLTLTLLTR